MKAKITSKFNKCNQPKQATFQIALFSETALVVLISMITLLLQMISFATTWNGSRIYLEGVFSHASLLFAVAIQATAYFFSNSLRTSIRPLKVIALCAALCCSTYYSYIGIYNSVNSPVNYLQENYVRISHELTTAYERELEENLASARKALGTATSLITARYTSLLSNRQQYDACRSALNDVEISYTSGLRPPRQASYENYEDYAAAYQAYINSASQGNNVENAAGREGILSSYGFSSVEELSRLEAENLARLQALETALGGDQSGTVSGIASSAADSDSHADVNQAATNTLSVISDLSVKLNTAISATAAGQPLDAAVTSDLNRVFQAAVLCGYEGMAPAQVTSILKLCADTTATGFLHDYSALVASLPEGSVTDANIMDLKSAMDSELLSGLMKLNALLPAESQIDFADERYQITDLYLIPVQSLRNQDTRTTAVFCLAVAALIDILSVLFAVSLRDKKPLWKKHTLLSGNLEDYAPYIYASLPATLGEASKLDASGTDVSEAADSGRVALGADTLRTGSSGAQPLGAGVSGTGDFVFNVFRPATALAAFMGYFKPSPQTEGDGYMMQADMDTLQDYGTLTAMLCQLNLAKIIPVGFPDNSSEILLLKARFVLWANSVIYEEHANAIKCMDTASAHESTLQNIAV